LGLFWAQCCISLHISHTHKTSLDLLEQKLGHCSNSV
jgi:hypothetical protein